MKPIEFEKVGFEKKIRKPIFETQNVGNIFDQIFEKLGADLNFKNLQVFSKFWEYKLCSQKMCLWKR